MKVISKEVITIAKTYYAYSITPPNKQRVIANEKRSMNATSSPKIKRKLEL